jgi:hypothetical protein
MTQEALAPKIYTVRGEPVVLDSDLALLYGVETRFVETGTGFQRILLFN